MCRPTRLTLYRLDGANRLGELIEGIECHDGERVQDAEEQAAA